jgi:hypothetical protein
VAVAGSAAAAAFSLSPFPDLLEAFERLRACHRMARRVLIRAPQATTTELQTLPLAQKYQVNLTRSRYK